MRCITEPTVVGRLIHYVQSLALNVRLLVAIADGPGNLPGFIALYLPLFAGGNMQVFTADSLSEPLTKQISLQAGAHALLITEANDNAAPAVSMLVREESALLDLRKTFERSLRYARPLLINLGNHNTGRLRENLAVEYSIAGDLDIVSDCPLPMFMTAEAFTAFLGANGLNGEALEEQNAAFLRLQGAMDEALGAHSMLRVMLRLSRIKQVLDEGECRVPGYLLLQDGIVTMDAAACAASLEGLLHYLKRFPDSVHLHLTNMTEPFSGDSCWHIKKDHHVSIASWAHGASDPLCSDDPALVRAFFARFQALWQNNSKMLHDRERTMFTLTEAIRLLHERYLN